MTGSPLDPLTHVLTTLGLAPGGATLAAGSLPGPAAVATATGARWHHDDRRQGGDRAQVARDRRTPLDAHRERLGRRRGVRGGRWIDRHGLTAGGDHGGGAVR